ncbi:MAG: ribonuclease III [Azospirillaceae bacterium]
MASTEPGGRLDLEDRLGHRFADPALLHEALSHASLSGDRPGGGAPSYQRLEFLGDRVLGLVMADWLLERFPGESEGKIAKRFAALVRGEACAAVARQIDLGAHIRLTPGEEGAGGRDKDSVLADACEAVIGALYRDGGLEAAARFIRSAWDPQVAHHREPPREPKTALQEWAQGRALPLPVYETLERSGPDHAPVFRIRVSVAQSGSAEAEGASKREAERMAARRLLEALDGGAVS